VPTSAVLPFLWLVRNERVLERRRRWSLADHTSEPRQVDGIELPAVAQAFGGFHVHGVVGEAAVVE